MEKIKEFVDEDENNFKKILSFIEEKGNIVFNLLNDILILKIIVFMYILILFD